uniref:Uncharacterized protein n=1 Tax=viral metagenome TaxID=1070528 RepID=A0A6M3XCZ5_9ZZZZ
MVWKPRLKVYSKDDFNTNKPSDLQSRDASRGQRRTNDRRTEERGVGDYPQESRGKG